MIYVAFRFEVGYAVGAITATLHDVLVTVGVFVLLGGQFSAPMVAAVLMIIGYSLNDTVIVFDRVREELKLNPQLKLVQVLDLAVNRTLARTTLTSLTTFLAATSLFIFGAGVVRDFALVFMIGILTGTASSIFIANPMFCWWHKGDRLHVESHEFLPKHEWEKH
jgi:SecD/SecF fusion protein